MYKLLLLLSSIVILSGCSKQKQEGFADPRYVTIANLQDRRLSDSLVVYFKDQDALIKERAVLAFASIQDSTVVADLADVLRADQDTSVRIAAAIALGQTRSAESENALKEAIDKEADDRVRDEIIEAYGKVTRKWNLSPALAERNPEGMAWSLYRASFNNAVDSSANEIAAGLLSENQTYNTRLGAAHYFARGAKGISSQFASISKSATADKNSEVRMASTFALRKIVNDSSFAALEKVYKKDDDYRVRISAIRCFQAFPFERSKNYWLKGLRDKNVNVTIAASEAIKASINENSWIDIANAASAAKNWRVQAELYQAVMKLKNNKGITEEVLALYKSANPYQKRALLYALQYQGSNADFIQREMLEGKEPVVKTAAAEALVFINKSKGFDRSQKKSFADAYMKGIAGGDPGVIATTASALADSTLAYRSEIKDNSFISTAKSRLTPIKDGDAINALDRLTAYLNNQKIKRPEAQSYNHPINWSRIKTLNKDQTVTVYTTKGKIKMRLLTESAPGSVANFLDLVDKKYFNNHFFHRVVPNFVVQVGDARGDGSGSEDYSIRSEFSKVRYTTGSVGMASSGKDTEGTQWFITHSPTPHLDGRYSIFAEVVEGMEAVHATQIGDQITKIEIDNSVKK